MPEYETLRRVLREHADLESGAGAAPEEIARAESALGPLSPDYRTAIWGLAPPGGV
jgi:hypothetical protein